MQLLECNELELETKEKLKGKKVLKWKQLPVQELAKMFRALIVSKNTDAQAWQLCYRGQRRHDIDQAMQHALLKCSPAQISNLLHAFTATPSMLAVRLGVVEFDEQQRRAVFSSTEGAACFAQRFPNWLTFVEES